MPLIFDKNSKRKKFLNAEAVFFDMKTADAGRIVNDTISCLRDVLQELERLTYDGVSGNLRAVYLMSVLQAVSAKLKVSELEKAVRDLAAVMEQGTDKRLEAIRAFTDYLHSLEG